MADDETTTTGATGGVTITTAPPTTPPPAPPAPDDDEEEPYDRDRAMATILKQREEAKALKAELREAKKLAERVAELEAAQLTEAEKQAKRLADLEAEQASWQAEKQELMLRSAFYGMAPRLAVADAELAYAALDRSAIEYADDGSPTNLEQVTLSLLDAKPILRGQPQVVPPPRVDGGAGRQVQPPPALTESELEAARLMGMTPERYAAVKGKRSVGEVLEAGTKVTGTTTT